VSEDQIPGKSFDRRVRRIAEKAARIAPSGALRGLVRWARGMEETHKLEKSDFAFVSYGKCGRTWLNAMLSKSFQLRYALPDHVLFEFDNLHRLNPSVPTILLTHDNYIRDFKRSGPRKTPFYGKPTSLLVRHPADIATSLFFHWQHRMRPEKKALNHFPAHGTEISIYDFVMYPTVLPVIVRYMNEWASEVPRMENLLLTRYEDLRADPHRELGRVLRWMGETPEDAEIRAAVDFAAFANLKKLEERAAFTGHRRLTPGASDNPDSYKVRRAKVGGYIDYFDDEQVRTIEAYIDDRLHPIFNYGRRPAVSG
jgi:hypothetical protein